MQLGPSFHQSSLSPGQTPSRQLYGVNAVHGLIIAMVGVKMGRVMRPQFAVHADDDSVKATQFRHKYVDQVSGTAASASPPNVPNDPDQWLAATGLSMPLDFIASLLHRVVPCASSRDLTRLFFRRLSLSHADPAETLPRRRHWLPKGDAAPHGVRLPRDPHKAIQPASENSSGVTIRGGGNPSALSVSYSAGSKSAFAMCLQFHVNK